MSTRFYIVGLGSMGKRRIRNLHVCGEKEIVGFDIRADRRDEAKEKYGIRVVDSFDALSPDDFDAMIISTSPDAHVGYIRYALANKKHFFIEHPASLDGYDDIMKNTDATVKAPSCTLRYYTPIKMMKKLLLDGAIGKVLAFQYHMGQYLPDWHPWEDYRDVYFSKKETSACREMLPFELIWLTWLLGSRVADISGAMTKISDLDMTADDIVLARVKHENGIIGNIVIDVISRKPFRTLRVLGSDGVLEWERFDHEIRLFHADSKTEEVIPVPKGNPETGYVNEEEMYNDEIKAFLDAVYGRSPYPFTFEENASNVGALLKIL